MAEPEKSIARNFFVEYSDRQSFLNEMVSMFDSCQYECLTQEDGLHANEEYKTSLIELEVKFVVYI